MDAPHPWLQHCIQQTSYQQLAAAASAAAVAAASTKLSASNTQIKQEPSALPPVMRLSSIFTSLLSLLLLL